MNSLGKSEMGKRTVSLKEYLDDWTDYDVAGYFLACSLGIMVHDDLLDEFRRNKGVFYTDNPIGNLLTKILVELADGGVLQRNDEGQFRWNPLA